MAKDDKKPTPADDIEAAEAKSGSVDERIPEAIGVDHARGLEAPAPAAYIPQAGVGVGAPLEEIGPGEQVLEKEREHLRIPRQRG